LWTQFTIFIILKNTKLIEFIPYTLWILVIFFRHYLTFNHRVTKRFELLSYFLWKCDTFKPK
jgi:hypothetical protein